MYLYFNEVLRRYGLQVEEGIFAAEMKVELLNDGPITICLDSEGFKMTQIIYGSELSAELKENMRAKVEAWASTGMRTPCLAVILVGDNPASESYVRGKEKACAAVGIKTNTIRLSASITQEELERVISDCSTDDAVDGILIQLHYQKALTKIERLRVLILGRM